MPTPKRLAKSQEQVAIKYDTSKRSFVLNRLIEEVAGPLDDSAALCQRLLDGSGGKLSLEQRKSMETARSSTERSSRRLRDYIDLMLLDAGEIVLRPRAHNLEDVIEQTARQVKPVARGKGLSLVIEPAVHPLPPVLADPLRVGQVLSTLLTNAVKFTDRGQVTISTELYDRSIAIHIIDTGAGIPAAQLPKLFEDFYQGDGAKSRDASGCGLGLTLCRRLVVRIGGDLWATSTVGVGSKFSFTVPRAPGGTSQTRLSPV